MVGSLDDQAAQLLLVELERTDDEEFRAELLRGLQAIRTFREERELWRGRLERREMRRTTISALLEIAEDHSRAAVRADALRALGALRASEVLPLALSAMASENDLLRQAALEALESLHRSPLDGPLPVEQGAPQSSDGGD